MGSKLEDDYWKTFDLNKDGKTDIAEKYMAFKVYEDITKDIDAPSVQQRQVRRASQVSFTPIESKGRTEPLTVEKYKEEKKTNRSKIRNTIVLSLIASLPSAVIMIAACSSGTFEKTNNATWFLAILFIILPIIVLLCVWYCATKEINVCLDAQRKLDNENISLLKENP